MGRMAPTVYHPVGVPWRRSLIRLILKYLQAQKKMRTHPCLMAPIVYHEDRRQYKKGKAGGLAILQKRKGRGHRNQEGREGGVSATIQKRKGRSDRNQEGTEEGGSAKTQKRKGRGNRDQEDTGGRIGDNTEEERQRPERTQEGMREK